MLSAVALNFEILFAIRMVMGVFAGGIIPVAMAAIGDRVPLQGRQVALGRFLTIMIVGQTAGAAASGLIADHFGWRAVMIVAALLAATAGALVGFLLKPQPNAKRETLSVAGAVGRYRSVFANPRSVILYGLVVIEGALIFGIMPYVAAILQDRWASAPPRPALSSAARGSAG